MRSRRSRALTLIALPCLLLACASEDTVDDSAMGGEAAMSAAVDVEAIRAEVATIREAWINAANNDDAAIVAGLYSDDAIVIGPDGTTTSGRMAIETSFATEFGMASALSVTPTDFETDGTMASEMGEFSQTVTSEAGEQTVTGRYLVVLKRQSDGAWKLVQHISAIPATM